MSRTTPNAFALTALLAGATMIPALAPAPAQAQAGGGYWTSPGAGNAIWKNGAGQCWRSGTWTPAMAVAECDPDLVPKPPAPKPAAVPAPAPAPVPAPAPAPKPAPAPAPAPKPEAKPAAAPAKPKPAMLRSTIHFEPNRATLDNLGKFRLDQDIINRLKALGPIVFVNVNGHADRFEAPDRALQRLSERRAEAVKAYLVAQGIDASRIEVYGYAKTFPQKSCADMKPGRVRDICLEPNRRVEVELQAAPKPAP